MSPVEVIKRLYEVAIVACRRQDLSLARKAVNELINGLNFDYDVAHSLYRLYDYAKAEMRKGNYDEAVRVLGDLRGAWVQAFKLE
jgi:flagellin-specific chaperone FliS